MMKGYIVSSFLKKKISETRDLGSIHLYGKSSSKALEILLECKKSVSGIKNFLPKMF